MIQISVVVCTYNRANLLAGALDSLIGQTLDKTLYEIIVVDNGSTDNICQIVERFQVNHPECNILLVREEILGLGNARNTGIRYAHGEYIAFMDDDAHASADWLKNILRCFREIQPNPLGVGGKILPFYESPKPKWFKDEYEIRTWGNYPRFLKHGESFSGSNMIFNKNIFKTYGGFNTCVGMKEERLLLGEETALFDKVWEFSNKKHDINIFYYLPQAVVFHIVPSYKMSLLYQLKRKFASGQSWYLLHRPKSIKGRLRLFIRLLFSIVKLTIVALIHIGEYRTYQNWMVERFGPIVGEIGRLTGCVGLPISVKQR